MSPLSYIKFLYVFDLYFWTSISLVYCLFRWAVPHYFMYKGFVVCFKEKAMAPHFSTLAWKIPGTEEPGRLQSMGLRLSDFTFIFHFLALEKEMATHSIGSMSLENPRDGGAWWAAVYGSHSRTWLKQLSSSNKLKVHT